MRLARLSLARLILSLIAFTLIAGPAQAERRAFVVGVANYTGLKPLLSPVFDANAFGELIKSYRFVTTVVENPTRDDLVNAWQLFLNQVQPKDEVLIFYSGHGIEIGGQNYLVPADAPAPAIVTGDVQLKSKLYPMLDLLTPLRDLEAKAGIMILDACRDNPYDTTAKSIGSKTGLKDPPAKPTGTFILYSADYGQQSRDRARNDPPEERHSVFTRVLLRTIRDHPKLPLNVLATRTKMPVLTLADPYPQVPTYYDGLMDLWCFDECPVTLAEAQPLRHQTLAELMTAASTTTITTMSDSSKSKDLAELARRARLEREAESKRAAVFLGRKSMIDDCKNQNPQSVPFGCEQTRSILAGATSGQPFKAPDELSMMRGLPTKGSPGCVVKLAAAGEPIVLSRVYSFSAGSGQDAETAYWATVVGHDNDPCLQSARNPRR